MQSQGLTDTNRAICHIPVSASRSFRAGSGRPLTITMARGSISGTALGLLLTPAAVQIAPSEQSGRNSSSAPECARSKVPGRSAWSLVRKSDRAGRTERAQKSGAGLPNTQPRIMTPCTATLPAHSARRTGGLIGSYASPGANRLRDPAGPSSEASRTQCQLRSRAALREIGALNWSFPISSE
jgi:hypothetical protein